MRQNDEPNVLLLRTPEAAKLLAISERSLWALTAPRGPIPVVRIGRSVRYSIHDLYTAIHKETKGRAGSDPLENNQA